MHLCQVYWSYWGILFASLLTWIFSVAAAAGESWTTHTDGSDGTSLENECALVTDDEELNKACDMCKCRNPSTSTCSVAPSFDYVAKLFASVKICIRYLNAWWILHRLIENVGRG